MFSIVQLKKMNILMLCFMSILSVALCLHFNEHASAVNQTEQHIVIDAAHTHHHEVSQSHTHQENLYEHVVGYVSLKYQALAFFSLFRFFLNRINLYALLMASRIFKPPKKQAIPRCLFNFGV